MLSGQDLQSPGPSTRLHFHSRPVHGAEAACVTPVGGREARPCPSEGEDLRQPNTGNRMRRKEGAVLPQSDAADTCLSAPGGYTRMSVSMAAHGPCAWF